MVTQMARANRKPAADRAGMDHLPVTDEDGNYLAVIEAEAGSRNKYKFDPRLRVMVLHKVLPLGTSFPYCFGFLPSTKGEDGDPLDVLVFMDEPARPGTVVPCRLLGVIEAEQTENEETVRNDRLLAAATESRNYRECRRLSDLADDVLTEVERFFVFYNQQRGVEFKVLQRRGKIAARSVIEAGSK